MRFCKHSLKTLRKLINQYLLKIKFKKWEVMKKKKAVNKIIKKFKIKQKLKVMLILKSSNYREDRFNIII